MEQSNFSEQEYDNLLQFAGLCTDIESQATYLHGLGYLNYPNAIQPITQKLLQFICTKWKKKLSTIQTAMAECIPLSQDSVQQLRSTQRSTTILQLIQHNLCTGKEQSQAKTS